MPSLESFTTLQRECSKSVRSVADKIVHLVLASPKALRKQVRCCNSKLQRIVFDIARLLTPLNDEDVQERQGEKEDEEHQQNLWRILIGIWADKNGVQQSFAKYMRKHRKSYEDLGAQLHPSLPLSQKARLNSQVHCKPASSNLVLGPSPLIPDGFNPSFRYPGYGEKVNHVKKWGLKKGRAGSIKQRRWKTVRPLFQQFCDYRLQWALKKHPKETVATMFWDMMPGHYKSWQLQRIAQRLSNFMKWCQHRFHIRNRNPFRRMKLAVKQRSTAVNAVVKSQDGVKTQRQAPELA